MPQRVKFSISRKPETFDLEFNPPLKSDELHDALKDTYPHLKTLQLRQRQAVIDFYKREQYEEDRASNSISSQNTKHSTPASTPASTPETNSSGNYLPIVRPDQAQSPSRLAAQPLKRKAKPELKSQNDSQQGKLDDINSYIHTFSLSKAGKTNHQGKRPKTQQQREAYRFRKQNGTCEKHRRRKRKVGKFIGLEI
jgi:hypothetical protein